MKYIAIISTDEPLTEHTIQDIKDTIFCGDEQVSYVFEIEDIKYKADKDEQNLTMKQEPQSEWQKDHEILKAHSDGAREALEDIRAKIAKYGSLAVSYVITDEVKTDKGIEKLVSDILHQAKEEVLEIIDKHIAERNRYAT